MQRPALIIMLIYGYIALCNMQASAQHSRRPVAVLPFRYDGVHIVIQATLTGYPDTLYFLFDTGAEVNVLENDWADKWKLKTTKEAPVSGFCNVMTYLPVAELGPLNLGAAHLYYQSFYLQDLTELSTARQRIDGIIGYQLLKNYTVRIDYEHHTLSLYPPGNFRYPVKGEVFHMGMNFDTPTLVASLPFTNGSTLEGVYHITTGGDYGILFNYPYVKKYHIDKALQKNTGTADVKDMLKTVEYVNGIALAVSIGKYHLRNVACSYSPDIDDGNPGKEIAGALGNNVWKDFIIILNYSQREIYLEPARRTGK